MRGLLYMPPAGAITICDWKISFMNNFLISVLFCNGHDTRPVNTFLVTSSEYLTAPWQFFPRIYWGAVASIQTSTNQQESSLRKQTFFRSSSFAEGWGAKERLFSQATKKEDSCSLGLLKELCCLSIYTMWYHSWEENLSLLNILTREQF